MVMGYSESGQRVGLKDLSPLLASFFPRLVDLFSRRTNYLLPLMLKGFTDALTTTS